MWPASRSISTSVSGWLASARASSSSATARLVRPASQRRLGCLPEQPPAPLPVGRQPSGPLERRRGGHVRAAFPAPDGRLGECRGRRFVRAGRGRGQMPGAAVHVPVGQRGGQRPVRRPPLRGRRVGVHRGPGQRMTELHGARVQRNQPRALRGGQRGQVDVQPGRRPVQRGQIPGIAGRGQHQGLPGGLAELAGPAQERAGDPGRHENRGALGGQHHVGSVRRQFQQRQRVAGGGQVQPPGRFRGQSGHQYGGLVAGQPAEPERAQIGPVQQGRLTVAHRDEHGDRVGHQPPEREQQCLRTRSVEPLGIVHQHGHRVLLGVRGEQAERCRTHREPVLGRCGPQRQRAFQRRGLGWRDLVEQHQSRPDQFQQRPERDLCLRFDAAGPQQLHPGRLAGRVVEQHCLADARFPNERQRRAGPRARLGQHLADFLPLMVPPQQHAVIVGTTWCDGAGSAARTRCPTGSEPGPPEPTLAGNPRGGETS